MSQQHHETHQTLSRMQPTRVPHEAALDPRSLEGYLNLAQQHRLASQHARTTKTRLIQGSHHTGNKKFEVTAPERT